MTAMRLLLQPQGALRSASQTAYAVNQASRGNLQFRRSMSASAPRALRMAVIGAGPAGFYTTQKILSAIPDAKVDMYERLPVPYGLSRFGVAPDHPEVKNCQEKFEEIAGHPGFSYIGNVSVGHSDCPSETAQVELATLAKHYDGITFSYGAPFDRHLGIPGEEELKGIYAAREFVSWYNGLPGHEQDFGLDSAEDAVVIGQGNVALDVARILLTPVDTLRKTDITESAIEQLLRSRVKRVHIVGRRGPMQVRLTIKELRELMTIPDVYFHAVDASLIPTDPKALPRQYKRLMDLLKNPKGERTGNESKGVSLDFCLGPKAFRGTEGRVSHSVFNKMALDSVFDPSSGVSATEEEVTLKSELVFRSIGYKSTPLTGFSESNVGFDSSRGIIRNDGVGRVLYGEEGSDKLPGFYCAGWAKRGPMGVIASTMADGFTTADTIVQDWTNGVKFIGERDNVKLGWDGVKQEIPSSEADKAIGWEQWLSIDRAERSRGSAIGKEREKFTNTKDMLEAST